MGVWNSRHLRSLFCSYLFTGVGCHGHGVLGAIQGFNTGTWLMGSIDTFLTNELVRGGRGGWHGHEGISVPTTTSRSGWMGVRIIDDTNSG
jgi:hypothetical protein